MLDIIKKAFGTRNERVIRSYRKVVKKINAIEADMKALSDQDIKNKTLEFKQRLSDGAGLDSLLTEAFALVREAAWRALGLRHFDVQLIGAMVLHDGNIAEMRTGEGKTLSATLPVYLNSLAGLGVHVVTVNDYLAERDANWMRPIYEFLGLTVGINLAGMSHEDKQEAYAADVTYGTNNEFGFDYLRDNMVYSVDQCVQRPLSFAIIDEVDSILIDEARTPLIISGQDDESSDLYVRLNNLVPQLTRQEINEEDDPERELTDEERGDYVVDEKNKQVFLTEQGHQNIENLLTQMKILQSGDSLYDVKNISLMHYVNAALRAYALFTIDVDYVVKDDQIIIVDEHTGRLMDGRRWSEGLHQAVEAKEGVSVQLENQTLAAITFQNYFRLYSKLSGMTGTADTEAAELQKTYGLEVIIIPTNKPMIRDDRADKVYLSQQEKFKAIVEDIRDCQQRSQPVLVGTASIENSELLSVFLRKEGIKHEVLNAKQHEREANIIAQAGAPGSITIATNMAGRGTDIVLGGKQLDDGNSMSMQSWQQLHDQVIASGGLHILGTERHESRRIDNQLRGRSGRQGDAGSSQFYLSMEDNLLRIFAGERLSNMMRKLGVKEGDVIQHNMINRSIEKAQRRVEGHNCDIRKQLLEFDDVANDQRKVIYQQRRQLVEAEQITKTVVELRAEVVEELVEMHMPPESLEEEWDLAALNAQLLQDFGLKIDAKALLDQNDEWHNDDVVRYVSAAVEALFEEKEQQVGSEVMRDVERSIMLQLFDTHWKDHLAAMDHLRQSIHLRGYAQKNPTQEFKRESFDMFTEMLGRVKYDFIATIAKVEFSEQEQPAQMPAQNVTYQHDESNSLAAQPHEQPIDEEGNHQPFVRANPKIGRNDPCHCGSGKKYKQCHGKLS